MVLGCAEYDRLTCRCASSSPLQSPACVCRARHAAGKRMHAVARALPQLRWTLGRTCGACRRKGTTTRVAGRSGSAACSSAALTLAWISVWFRRAAKRSGAWDPAGPAPPAGPWDCSTSMAAPCTSILPAAHGEGQWQCTHGSPGW